MLFSLGFTFLFTAGGIPLIVFANSKLDLAFLDTCDVAVYFRYVLYMEAAFF